MHRARERRSRRPFVTLGSIAPLIIAIKFPSRSFPEFNGPRRRMREKSAARQNPLRDRVMYGARERRQASIRPSIYLSRFYLCETALPLVARRPVKPSSIEHLSAIGSPTTPAIKENMSDSRESHDLAHCCRSDLLDSPLPLPAFQMILLTMNLDRSMLMISLLKLKLTVLALSIFFFNAY